VLLVEDNPGDVRLTHEVLREAPVPPRLHVAPDGERALEMMRGVEVEGHPARRPDLVLLDLNLPRLGGTEVLRECKADDALRRTPIVVLSSSAADRDIVSSYELGANAYISKPVALEDFLGVVRAIERFWLGVATLPPG
jgi:two-component system, chemotaxis family, response regulator Rcp1